MTKEEIRIFMRSYKSYPWWSATPISQRGLPGDERGFYGAQEVERMLYDLSRKMKYKMVNVMIKEAVKEESYETA